MLLQRRRRARSDEELVAGLTSGIFSARQSARIIGRRGIAELLGGSASVDFGTRLADAARAQQVARRHLQLVQQERAKAVLAEAANPERAALVATESRIRLISASETFSAATEERIATAREVQAETGIELWKSWNAEHDSCPVCKDLDGTEVRVDESFPGGREPGSAHPGCQCWPEILTRAGRKAA